MTTAPTIAAPLSAPPTRGQALVDILTYVAAAAAFFGIEELLRSAGWFPYPGLFDGGPTLIASFFVVLAILRARGQRWTDLGLRRPAHWWTVPVFGLVVLVVNAAAQLTIVPVIASLVNAPEPDLGRYDVIRGNLPIFVISALGAMVTGGFIEEVIYRGLMVDRLARLFRGGRRGLVLGALFCGVPFGLVHFAWGPGGVLVTTVMGSVMGFLYLATGRNLWPLVAGHATLDALLMTQAYLGRLN